MTVRGRAIAGAGERRALAIGDTLQFRRYGQCDRKPATGGIACAPRFHRWRLVLKRPLRLGIAVRNRWILFGRRRGLRHAFQGLT